MAAVPERIAGEVIVQKRCCLCRKVLPIGRFSRDASSSDGYKYACAECAKERDRMRYQKRKAAGIKRKREARKPEPVWPIPAHDYTEIDRVWMQTRVPAERGNRQLRARL